MAVYSGFDRPGDPLNYEKLLNQLFGSGGMEGYIRNISQQAGTQIGMATMPQFQQYMKQYAGGLAGRGGLGGGAQVWAMGEAQKARSGQMIGAVAGATQSAQRDVLSAKQQILQMLIQGEMQRMMEEQRSKQAMWGSFGEVLGAVPQAVGAYYGAGG